MRNKILIKISTIQRLKKFVHIIESLPYEVDASQNRYRVRASSIMGMFSLDLTQDITVEPITEDKDQINDFIMQMGEFTKGVE